MDAIISAIAGIFVTLLVGIFVTKLDILAKIYDARVSEKGIEFVLLTKVVFYVLQFDNIAYAAKTKGGYGYLFVYNLKNRFFKGCLFIQKKKGVIVRRLLISPADINAFAARLVKAGVIVKGLTEEQAQG
jgi:hypothetical protein